jgi:glycosyltransferase involved in cell wall biosynthesis
MPEYYAMADAMLVTMQKNPVLSMTLPGKVQTYMAAGKLIIGAIDGETADVIRQAGCGICVNACDYVGLSNAVREWITNRGIIAFERNTHEYFTAHFEKARFFDRLGAVLNEMQNN